MYRRRFLVSYAFIVLAAAALAGGALWQTAQRRSEEAWAAAHRCPHQIPSGRSLPAAWDTTVLFVTEVVLRRNPVCGYDLSTRKLRRGLTRREWASGEGPVRPFVTRYPPVPITEASADPAAPQAVYIVSRRAREIVVPDERGRPKVPMMVGLAAPDAGMVAYDLVLVLEDGSWRVDRVWPVRLRATSG